jgi:hypothetical protein
MGSDKTANPPARVTMMDKTEANIGRLMKKLENIPYLDSGRGRDGTF